MLTSFILICSGHLLALILSFSIIENLSSKLDVLLIGLLFFVLFLSILNKEL